MKDKAKWKRGDRKLNETQEEKEKTIGKAY